MRDGALIRNPQFECGGGGFVSTPRDSARWMAALRQGTAFPDTLWPAAVAKPAGVADTAHHRRGIWNGVSRVGVGGGRSIASVGENFRLGNRDFNETRVQYRSLNTTTATRARARSVRPP